MSFSLYSRILGILKALNFLNPTACEHAKIKLKKIYNKIEMEKSLHE